MLHKFWKTWLHFGEIIGNIVGQIILTVFYFTLFALPGIYFAFFSDKIGKKTQDKSYFSTDMRDLELTSLESAREL